MRLYSAVLPSSVRVEKANRDEQTRPYLWDRRLCCLLFSVFPLFCSSDFTWIFLMRTELRIMNGKKRQEGSVVNVRHIEHATRPGRWLLPSWFLIFFFHVCTLKCLTSNKYLNFSQRQHKSTQNAVFKQRYLLLSGGEKKSKPTQPWVKWGKSDCPLNLITAWATLSINNCKSCVCNYFNESLTALWRNSSLQNCCNSATLEGFPARTAFLRSCHSISIGFRSGLWLGHSKVFLLYFFLSHSEGDLLVSFGSSSCCRTQVRSTFSFRSFW